MKLDDDFVDIEKTPISAGVAPTSTWAGEWTHYQFADINGDGLADAVSNESSRSSYLNTGAGFVVATGLNAGTMVDVNEDGILDSLLGANLGPIPLAPPIYAAISDRMGSQKPIESLRDTNGNEIRPYAYFTADIDGDGRVDLISTPATWGTSAPFTIYVRDGKKADLVTGITTPLGHQIDIDYAPTSKAATRGHFSYPVYNLMSGVWVVSAVHDHDTRQPTVTTEYYYDSPGVDLLGRGWLGFANRVAVTKDTSGYEAQRTTTSFDLSWIGYSSGAGGRVAYPYLGLPKREVTTTHVGAEGFPVTNDVIRDATFKKVSGTLAAGQSFSIGYDTVTDTEQEIISGFEAFGVQPTVFRFAKDIFTYDPNGHGNVETKIRQFTDGKAADDWTGGMKSTFGYTGDESTWLIGALKSSKVQDASGDGPTLQRTADYVVSGSTGLVDEVTYQKGLAEQQLDVVYTRGERGLVSDVTRTDPVDGVRVSSFKYDDDGVYVTSTTDAGMITTNVYHPGLGSIVVHTDVNGLATHRTFDGFGRLRSETQPSGAGADLYYEVAKSTFAGSSYQVRKVTHGGGATVTTLDELGRPTWQEMSNRSLGETVVTTATYDPNHPNQVKSFTEPVKLSAYGQAAPKTERTFDNLGRLTAETGPEGSASTTNYVYFQQQVVQQQSNGHSRTIFTDGRRRLREVRDAIPADDQGPKRDIVTNYTYGAFGTIRFVDNGTAAPDQAPSTTTRTSFTYDDLSRRNQMVDPDSGTTTTHYNGFGEIREIDDPNGDTIQRFYDGLGRPTSMTNGDGTTTYLWDLAPGGIGKPSGTSSPTGVLQSFTYDDAGRLSAESWQTPDDPAVFVIGHGYDAFGRENLTTYPSAGDRAALSLGRSYDEDGAVQVVRRGSDVLWAADHRDVYGGVDAERNGAGVSTSRVRDPQTGQTTHIEVDSGSGQVVRALDYSYYPWRDVKTRTVDGATEAFCYDQLRRLTGWAHTTSEAGGPGVGYRYDDRGNMIRRTEGFVQYPPAADGTCAVTSETSETVYTPGTATTGPHRLASSTDGVYGYDDKGNQTSAPGRTVTYTSFDLPATLTTSAGTTTFRYDAADRRVMKETGVGSTLSIGGLYERRVSNGQTTHIFYVRGAGHQPIAQIEWTEANKTIVGEATMFIYADLLGSTAASGASGVLANRSYDPFGRRTEEGDPAVRTGFAGHRDDAEDGLVDMNGRVYDPRTARFVTPDPFVRDLLDGQGLNRYAYVGNNPVSYIDPSGFLSQQGPATPGDVKDADGVQLGNGALGVTLGGKPDQSAGFNLNPIGPGATVALSGDGNDSSLSVNSPPSNVSTNDNEYDNVPTSDKHYETVVTAPPPAAATTVTLPWGWVGAGAGAGGGAAGLWDAIVAKIIRHSPVGVFFGILLTPSKIGAEGPMHPPPAYPGDDPTKAPGPDWEWKGKGEQGSSEGNYVRPNPNGGRPEYLHPDLDHPLPIGPHWDWHDPDGRDWRIFPDNTVMPK
jgi:RHS repeat-associated protein